MTIFCNITGNIYEAQRAGDCDSDGWNSIEVDRAGNVTTHNHFDTEDEAEADAAKIQAQHVLDHSRIGVGA